MDSVGRVAFDRRRTKITTITSSDYFQHYIPLYCYTIRKAYPDFKIAVGVTEDIDDLTVEAMNKIEDVVIRKAGDKKVGEDAQIEITTHVLPENMPVRVSTINMMRFLLFPACDYTDQIIITDVDLLLFKCQMDLLEWFAQRMQEMDTCYAGYHGPLKKPHRFPDSWTGDKERVAGGFLMVSKVWLDKTKSIREKYTKLLEKGEIGTYREEDEVVLCKIIKEAGMPVPPDKIFPVELRGIHLGDLKFDHRRNDIKKMKILMSEVNCIKYLELLQSDEVFRDILEICCKDPVIAEIFLHLDEHIKIRGLK